MKIQESAEMYLETIYTLSLTLPAVRSIDVADSMNFSKPSVSRAVRLLKKEGMVEMDKDNYLTLTEKGRELAEKIYERHTVLENMLIKLGVDPETASKDACKIEHVISDETFEIIKKHIS